MGGGVSSQPGSPIRKSSTRGLVTRGRSFGNMNQDEEELCDEIFQSMSQSFVEMCEASGRPELMTQEGKQHFFKQMLRKEFGMENSGLQSMDFGKAKFPTFPTHHVKAKAVDMMGDTELENVNKELLPANANVSSKALHLVGDSKVIQSEKLRSQVGSIMSPEQVRKQRVAEIHEEKQKAKQSDKELQKLLRLQSVDSDPSTLPKKQVADKVLDMMGCEELEGMNKELLPANAKVSSKALHLVGDSKVIQSDKARKQMGSVMIADQVKAQKLAEEAEASQKAKEAETNIKQIVKMKSVKCDPVALPKSQVRDKALDMMGDSSLEELNKELLPEKAQVNSKALHLVGDSKVIQSEKVRQLQGSNMDPKQIAAMKKEETNEIKRKKSLAESKVREILKEKTPGDLEASKPKHQVQDKALDMLGDQTLQDLNKELLPSHAKVSSKALHMVGDSKVIQNEKARKRMGSMMHADQVKAQKLAEELEERKKKNEASDTKKAIVMAKRCGDEKAVAGEGLNQKALKMMGDNKVIQNERVRKRMGSMMKPNQIEAQRLAEELEAKHQEKFGHVNSFEGV